MKNKLSKGKIYPGINVIVLKYLLLRNKDFLAKLISLTTKIDYNQLLDNMYLTNEYLDYDKLIQCDYHDIYVEIDGVNINITKNAISPDFDMKKRDFDKGFIFYTISLSEEHLYNNDFLITEEGFVERTTGKYEKQDNCIRRFKINFNNIKNDFYTNLDEVDKYYKFLILDDIEELELLSNGDKILEKALNTLKEINTNKILMQKNEILEMNNVKE